MSYLYDSLTDKELPPSHYVIRFRRGTHAPWESMTHKYVDFGTVRAAALQYIRIHNRLPSFELFLFEVRDGVHTEREHYAPQAS